MLGTLWIVAVTIAAAVPAAPQGTISGKVALPDGSRQTIVVYIEKGPERGGAPAARARKELAQKDTEFQPGVLWVRAGDSLDVANRDNFYHNVFSPTPGNEFDLGLYRGGVSKQIEMRHPGEVDVYCNIHPNMRAKVLVVPDERVAPVAADGSYSLDGLAPGDYTLVAWSAVHEAERRQVRLRAGEPVRVDFSLKARGRAGPHLNKSGEQYGRYK